MALGSEPEHRGKHHRLGRQWRARLPAGDGWRQLAPEALAQLDVSLDVRHSIDSSHAGGKAANPAGSRPCRITAAFSILDKANRAAGQNESERLFAVVRRLQQQGLGIVFISHRIHELKAVCDIA